MITELKEGLYSVVTTDDYRAHYQLRTALYTIFCTNTLRARTSKRLSPATFTQLNTTTSKATPSHLNAPAPTQVMHVSLSAEASVPVMKDPL